MKTIFETNGLVSYTEKEIEYREFFIKRLSQSVADTLRSRNSAWKVRRIETSTLLPTSEVNPEYNKDSYFQIGELSLRPETTIGSYRYAENMIDEGVMPPLCVWQAGKSYRNENDQVSKNIRLKEFYQMEFQCIFSETTKDDYHTLLVEAAKDVVAELLKVETRIVESDRLPSYSTKTFDVEILTPHKWLEVCSISERTDFKKKFNNNTTSCKVVEIAFGLDRLISLLSNHS